MDGPAPAAAPLYNDVQGLEQLRSAAAKDPSAALQKVAQQFEGLFIQMMLKSMRDAAPADGPFSSDTMKTYQEMYDGQLAMSMARDRHMGIADMLVKQLGGIVAAEQGGDAAPGASGGDAGRKAAAVYRQLAVPDTGQGALKARARGTIHE